MNRVSASQALSVSETNGLPRLFVASDRNLSIWNINVNQEVTPSALRSIQSGRIAIDPSGHFLAMTDSTVIANKTIHIFEIDPMKMLYTFMGGVDNPCFSRDGGLLGYIAIENNPHPTNGQAYLIDVKTGKMLWHTRKEKTFFWQ